MNYEQLFSLKNKVALVTGGSSGLGEHFAEVLAKAGAYVFISARRKAKLNSVVERLSAKGLSIESVEMDVTDSISVREGFKQISFHGKSLDILINNAGMASRPSRFIDQDEQDWDMVLETNLKGAWRVAQTAAKSFVEKGSGIIVNTSSIYGLVTGIKKTDYNVSKVAILQLTRNMALELGRKGIRVNALCPGYFKTELNAAVFDSDSGKKYLQNLVPQRLGNFDELTGPLLLLCSNAGTYINGSSLVVDGGSVLAPV